MKNIWTVMRKELARVFKNPRLFFGTVIMPGLLIFLLYSALGPAISSASKTPNQSEATLYIFGEVPTKPYSFLEILKQINEDTDFVFSYKDLGELEESKKLLDASEEVNLLLVFDSDFGEKMLNSEAPSINVYYNLADSYSASVYQKVVIGLETYRSLVLEHLTDGLTLEGIFGIAADGNNYDLTKFIAKNAAMILPMLIITFLFQAAIAIGPEAMAGEKERGTISTLLVTPTKRSQIALGKVFSLSLIAVMSGIISFVGIIGSLPSLFQGLNLGSIYNIGDYFLVFMLIVISVILIMAIITIISTFAKNLKEAAAYSSIVMLISMALGFTTMFANGAATNTALYLIPVYNTVQIFYQIFTLNVSIVQFLITIFSNLAFVAILTYLLTLMLNSEKIMLRK